MKAMQLPEATPRDAPDALWALQRELLTVAEALLGPRDMSKKIYQPQFTDAGPHVRNTPNQDGAFAELSRRSECDWPNAIFELAHETVHLLDPILGGTNNLEEGVAVSFSLHIQSSYNIRMQPSVAAYLEALQLADMLPGGPLEAARRVRERVGALSGARASHLEELFPDVDRVVLSRLAGKFVRGSE